MPDSKASGGTERRLTHEVMAGLIPFADILGLELVCAAPERVEGRLAYSPERCTSGGVLHGRAHGDGRQFWRCLRLPEPATRDHDEHDRIEDQLL